MPKPETVYPLLYPSPYRLLARIGWDVSIHLEIRVPMLLEYWLHASVYVHPLLRRDRPLHCYHRCPWGMSTSPTACRLLQGETDLGLQEELSRGEVRSLTHGTGSCPRGCCLEAGVQICHARVNHGSSISSYAEPRPAVECLVVLLLTEQGRSIL